MSDSSAPGSSASDSGVVSRSVRRGRPGLVALLAGIAATVATYQALPLVSRPGDKLHQYLCEHPLEYVLLAMFFVGLAHVGLRLIEGRRRMAALRSIEPSLRQTTDEPTRVWREAAATTGDEVVAARLHSLADLHDRWTGGSVVEYAQLFSTRAGDAVAGGYAVLNTILWAIPIVGFLGTVMGITLAIASITPEQLEGSLVSVTGNLAIAFDTTALSLGFSLVLGFASLVARRTEEQTLVNLDQLTDAWLLPLFAVDPPAAESPLTVLTADWSTEVARQREELIGTLSAVMAESEASFRRELDDRRAEAIDRQVEDWDRSTAAVRESIDHLAVTLRQTLDQTTRDLVDGVQTASGQANETLSVAAAQQDRWSELLDSTQRLEALQTSIDSQLQGARVAEQLDQTVHQLTAAVHLMTSRAKAA